MRQSRSNSYLSPFGDVGSALRVRRALAGALGYVNNWAGDRPPEWTYRFRVWHRPLAEWWSPEGTQESEYRRQTAAARNAAELAAGEDGSRAGRRAALRPDAERVSIDAKAREASVGRVNAGEREVFERAFRDGFQAKR
jgi:hypothetical protein